ncbi:MAG: prepilin-type N-terminal cleavage/methylation domain-containing protein [Syntrophaceae bacterium]|nr:prepilin-type N-terminal cleavage/methylation domain-containing protein [Syntrophaceae bacterium]
MKNNRGFTLIELIISMAVTALLLAAVYLAVNSSQRHSTGIERKVVAQQDAKSALNLMAMEIAMASCNPNFASNIWLEPPGSGTCGAVSTNPLRRGIQEATTTSIAVEMDVRGNNDGDPEDGDVGDPNEMIRYNYDAANRYITRATSCGGGNQPFLGSTSAPRNVRVINGDLGIPVFRYYDGAGTEIASTGLPAGIPDIRRIEITLALETEGIDPNTGQRKRLIYSTSVIPRNHVISQ